MRVWCGRVMCEGVGCTPLRESGASSISEGVVWACEGEGERGST